MVSFWPWKGNPSSTASFEKTLSALSAKIADTQSRLDRMRASSRRARVLCTLYLSFAYLVYAIVLLLVLGYKSLGAYECTALAGGPVLIYAARTLITAYYNFRIESRAARLKEYQEERAKTIQKLKDATKYDSTLELIEKYGGTEGSPKSKNEKQDATDKAREAADKRNKSAKGTPSRTTIPPPPTANIKHRDSPLQEPSLPPRVSLLDDPSAEFAPNAFSSPPPSYSQQQHHQPAVPESHWYDRIFDVLLGEDETAPKNRIVLICRSCRLVNGQAPPGTKSLADIGVWRCMACSAANGEVDEGERIVQEVLGAQRAADGHEAVDESEDEAAQDDAASSASRQDEAEGPVAGVRARRGKGSK